MQIKLFTHGADLDGVGCAILAYLTFGRENVDVEYCDYDDVNGKIREFYLCDNLEDYDEIYITDISVDEEVAAEIDSLVTAGQNWKLFDHHATALGLNQYEWCVVKITTDPEWMKTSGTELLWDYLNMNSLFEKFDFITENKLMTFVEMVRDYDTWRWKDLEEDYGLTCKKLNDLFYIFGREEFVRWVTNQITVDFTNVFSNGYFDETEQALLDQKQKDIDIYVAEKEKQLRVATDQFGKTFGWVFAERYFSELGNRLCELHPEIEYVAMIDISKGVVSFRSVKENVDLCNGIAHSLGGGGHKKAAGSRFDSDDVSNLLACKIFKGNIMDYLISKRFPAHWDI